MRLPRYLIRGTLLILIVLLTLAVGYWNLVPTRLAPQTLQAPQQPDFFMVNPRIRQLNEQGQPTYDLTSERAAHMQGRDITELDEPRLRHYREGAQPWDMQARYGEVRAGGEQVELRQEVIIEQPLGQDSRRLLTPALSVFPERDYAETGQAVRIETGGVTTATGMKAYLNDGRVELLSNVRGEHEAR